jgi:ADP-heptose:LPS heptosyltransferase
MRVVVIFPGALGDLCLLAPSLAAVRGGGVAIAVSVQRCLEPVARMLLPTVELGPPTDGAAMASLFGGALDPAVVRWLDGAERVHAWLARAADPAAVSTQLAARGAVVALHAVPRQDDDHHVSVDYAAAFGLLEVPQPSVAVVPPSTAPSWRRPAPARLVVHPGAGARAKVWAREGFQRVADGWRSAGGDVAVLLGPAEEGDADVWKAAGYVPVTEVSIADAAAWIASAPTFVGNDSGVSHLAGALARRGVVLFGPTRPARWRPLGGRLDVVSFSTRSADVVARDVLACLGAPVP